MTSGPPDSEPRTALPAECGPDDSRRQRRFRVAAVLVGLFAGLLLAEVSARMLGLEPQAFMTKRQLTDLTTFPPVYYHCYPTNFSGDLSPVPDTTAGQWRLQEYTFEKHDVPLSRLQETPWCVEYLHSSQGIRDREYSGPPLPGVTRIAVVGDSFVFGEGVPEPLCLPRQLENLLGDRFECINGGQVGANAEQSVAILNAIVPDTASQRAILVLIPNDIGLTPILAREQDYINDFVLIRDRYLQGRQRRTWHGGRSRLVDLVATPLTMRQVRQDTLRWYLDCYSPERNGANLARLQQQLAELAARNDCQVAVVIYPLMEGFEDGYPLAPVHAAISERAQQAGLPVFDLAPVFDGMRTKDLWVDETDHHPNGKAHRIAAAAIADWLRTEPRGFLDENPADSQRQSAASRSPVRFKLATDCGIDFVYYGNPSPEHYMTEQNGGGVALLDFDRDGRLDAYFPNGSDFQRPAEAAGETHRLYQNRMSHQDALQFADVSRAAGLARSGFGMGAAAADYDNDGFPDLLLCEFGGVTLWRNNGDGSFTDVTRDSGIVGDGWATGAAWADLDHDGDLDLYVTNYVDFSARDAPCYTQHDPPVRILCGPIGRVSQPDFLWENRGDGTFVDVSESAGIRLPEHGKGLAVEIVDLNGDDRLDIYVANDTTANFLFLNQGEMRFEEAGHRLGVAVGRDGGASSSMGIACADFDGNGRFDLFVTNFENAINDYYANDSSGVFLHTSDALGLDILSRPMLAFGTVAADFDLDQYPDLFVANGHIWDLTSLGYGHQYAMPPQLFHNRNGDRFADVSAVSGEYFNEKWLGRAATVGDLDNDGDADLIVTHLLQPPAVLLNESDRRGRSTRLHLIGRWAPRDPQGIRITCRIGDRTQHYHVPSGGSFAATHDPRVLLSTGDAEVIDEISIHWQPGVTESRASIEWSDEQAW